MGFFIFVGCVSVEVLLGSEIAIKGMSKHFWDLVWMLKHLIYNK